MATSAAERQRRFRRHRRGDHSLCQAHYCAALRAGQQAITPSDVASNFDGQALYRFFSSDGDLLYVGITCDVPARFRAHRNEKPWWTSITRITVEHYPDRASVEQAEREAIDSENPRWNVVRYIPRTPAQQAAEASALTKVTLAVGDVSVALESAGAPDKLAETAMAMLIQATRLAGGSARHGE